MPNSDEKKPRWTRRKEARSGELLEAALDLFVERGFAATRLDDVAKCAGVSKGTLYLYFSSKEELFKAVVRENILPMIGEAEEIVDQFPGSTPELFRTMMYGWWERVGNTRLSGIRKLVMSEAGNFPELAQFYHQEVVIPSHRIFCRMLERGVERGEFREICVDNVSRLIAAPIMMLMMWKHTYASVKVDSITPEAYLESFIDLYLNGLIQHQVSE